MQSLPALQMGAGTSASSYVNMFVNCLSLADAPLVGVKFSINVSGGKLSAAALNALYSNLATVTSQTITVSGNWGAAGDDPTIATAKGWTVTG